MFRSIAAAALLATIPEFAQAQSASAPLVVSATVVSTCTIDVPRSAERSLFASMPVAVTCARRGTTPRIQRPPSGRRGDVRDALLLIDF